jgi:hypothetical protein
MTTYGKYEQRIGYLNEQAMARHRANYKPYMACHERLDLLWLVYKPTSDGTPRWIGQVEPFNIDRTYPITLWQDDIDFLNAVLPDVQIPNDHIDFEKPLNIRTEHHDPRYGLNRVGMVFVVNGTGKYIYKSEVDYKTKALATVTDVTPDPLATPIAVAVEKPRYTKYVWRNRKQAVENLAAAYVRHWRDEDDTDVNEVARAELGKHAQAYSNVKPEKASNVDGMLKALHRDAEKYAHENYDPPTETPPTDEQLEWLIKLLQQQPGVVSLPAGDKHEPHMARLVELGYAIALPHNQWQKATYKEAEVAEVAIAEKPEPKKNRAKVTYRESFARGDMVYYDKSRVPKRKLKVVHVLKRGQGGVAWYGIREFDRKGRPTIIFRTADDLFYTEQDLIEASHLKDLKDQKAAA